MKKIILQKKERRVYVAKKKASKNNTRGNAFA
jgi:hypothetical protein